MGTGPGVTASTIALDDKRTYQSMLGFGASLTDSSATLIANTLSPTQRTAVMSDLFDPQTSWRSEDTEV